MRKNVIRWLLLVFVLALLPAAVYAQDDVSDDEVNEVAKDLYCPVCESTPLDVCPTQACADWRELIRTKLADGETQQDVLDYFARQYGDGVLANPPRRGVSLVVLWVLPALGLILGLLLFGWLLRGLRRNPSAATAATTPASAPSATPVPTGNQSLDDYIARVEREIGE